MTRPQYSRYDDERQMVNGVARGLHRNLVGGMWDEIGQWQFDLMRSVGLEPGHTLLDVGCGSLRGGVRFVPYLEPGHYHGFDINRSLIDAGYEREIEPAGLAERLPRENLAVSHDFDCGVFDRRFDYALAVSVFTHLPLPVVETGLSRVAAALARGGSFVFTYFECPQDASFEEPILQGGGPITTFGSRNPYHQTRSSLAEIARRLDAELVDVAFRPHPRSQKPMMLTPR